MSDDRASQFLTLIRRAQRGRHKVYLGYGPGVGKTSLMLEEGHRLKTDGIDVVAGVIETHGRAGTARLIEDLEVVPRRTAQYHGIAVDEMDLDALLARRPQVALVDELAHTNLPGSRNAKRWQDVQELLAAGIHVISTINVQHLESLYDTVERQIGIKVRERIPDAVLAEADQVVSVDLAPEDLQQRLQSGQLYSADRVPAAMENFFKAANLEQLRELTLRELAAQIDFRRREVRSEHEGAAPDQIMVCLSSRGPSAASLLRYASRLAGRLNRTWYAVYVQTPTENPLAIDAVTQRLLAETLTLANQLGAMVFTFTGSDIAHTIVRFAREYRVGHVVIGRPRPLPAWRRLLGGRSIAERLIGLAGGLTVVVVDAQGGAGATPPAPVPAVSTGIATAPTATAAASADAAATLADASALPAERREADVVPAIARLLAPGLIVVWDAPVARAEVLRRLVEELASQAPEVRAAATLARLEDRERQGSTFLNEGLALPHARVPGLSTPHVALGLTRAGISDVATATPVTMVFLVLSPGSGATAHLRLLAAAGRVFHDRELRRRIAATDDPAEIFHEIVAAGGPGS